MTTATLGPYDEASYDISGTPYCGYGTTMRLQVLNTNPTSTFVLFYVKLILEYDVAKVNSCTVPSAATRGDFNFNGWLDIDFDYIRYRRVQF